MIRKLLISAMASACIATTANAQAVTGPASAPDASPAASTTVILNTSPLYANVNQSYHACNIVNVTTKSPVSISVQIIDYDGNILASNANYTLAPGKTIEVSNYSSSTSTFARCQIVFKGSSTYVRANETVYHYTGSYYDAIAFSEAR